MSQNTWMKEKYKILSKRLLKFVLCYIIVYIIFLVVLSITEVIIINTFGLNINLYSIIIRNFNSYWNFIIYTIAFDLVNIIIHIYDRLVIKILNSKLDEMKRRIEINV